MTKTALILADDAKGLQRIYGVPAVRRLVLMAHRLRFDRVHLIVSDPRLLVAVYDLIGSDAFHRLENGFDACGAVEKLDLDENESVLVIKANHVIDRWSLERLLQAGQNGEIVFLKGDEIEWGEAIFLVKASGLPSLLASFQSSKGWETGSKPRAIHVHAGPRLPELLNGGFEKVRNAEAGLAAAVAESTLQKDSFLSRHLNRRLSRLVSPAIARSGMTANMVTLVNTMIGLAGAYLIFRGGHLSQIAGALLFLLSTIVDGVDGEVARLKLQETDFGGLLDVACDNIVHVSLFAAVGLALYHETTNRLFLYLLCLLLGGFGLVAFLINRVATGDRSGPQPTRLAVLLEVLFNNRDFAYIVFGFALFHHLDWFFVASVFGIYALAGTLWAAKLASRPTVVS